MFVHLMTRFIFLSMLRKRLVSNYSFYISGELPEKQEE